MILFLIHCYNNFIMILFHKDYGFFLIDVRMENPSHQLDSSSSSSSEDEDIKSKVTRV